MNSKLAEMADLHNVYMYRFVFTYTNHIYTCVSIYTRWYVNYNVQIVLRQRRQICWVTTSWLSHGSFRHRCVWERVYVCEGVMCMCVCVCVYHYPLTLIWTIPIQECVWVCACVRERMCVRENACVTWCVRVHMCACVWACIYIYIYLYTYVYVYTYIHVYI